MLVIIEWSPTIFLSNRMSSMLPKPSFGRGAAAKTLAWFMSITGILTLDQSLYDRFGARMLFYCFHASVLIVSCDHQRLDSRATCIVELAASSSAEIKRHAVFTSSSSLLRARRGSCCPLPSRRTPILLVSFFWIGKVGIRFR